MQEEKKCEWCRKEMTEVKMKGRPRRFCSQRCQKAARRHVRWLVENADAVKELGRG